LDLEQAAAAIVLFETPRPKGAAGPGRAPSLRELIATYRDPLTTIRAAPEARAARARWEERAIRQEAWGRARRLDALGGQLLLASDRAFPGRLAALEWGPPWLFTRGAGRLPEGAVAIVGTRRATPSASEFTRMLARAVARAGVCIASGLARGIDAAAHRGALAGGGETVAVLGTGVDLCYPAANRRLYGEVLQQGLAVSELPPGTPPLKHHFPARNRILAGLARAVVVAQAPEKSGALITAEFATRAGGDVLAVPGDPLLEENGGSNRLIADGARVTLGVEDVLSAFLGYEVPAPRTVSSRETIEANGVPHAKEDLVLLDEIDFVPRDVDRLAAAAGHTVADTLAALLRLELAGLVERLQGGRVRLTPAGARARRAARADHGE
jgi:DNA processing protein